VKNYLPDTEIFIVRGESYNMKLTYKEDIYILDKWFQLKTFNSTSKQLNRGYMNKLAGKTVVVFGGSSGIGLNLINMCRHYNANAVSFSRSENGVDISDASSVKDALNKVIKKQGRIDYIVNTAGILQREPLADMKLEDIINSININYLGAVIIAREAFPFIRESRGHILFFTSSSYTRGRSMYSIYSSSKAAIVNLTQALSDEWGDFGIRINCINPERTRTPMRTKNFGIEPVDTLLEPEKVAGICIKTMLSNISGQVIDVRREN
ncbi:MAG: SDR family oxidoreductase, partial [Bacteroidota bacterium]|nr:SDR family oxidoreductase [Bacteroidota bacterium]